MGPSNFAAEIRLIDCLVNPFPNLVRLLNETFVREIKTTVVENCELKGQVKSKLIAPSESFDSLEI